MGSAYRAGFAWALERGFDVIVEMDADLSHDPADLPRLVAAVDDGADLARRLPVHAGRVDSRRGPGTAGRCPGRATGYAAAVLRLPVTDATSGFRAYRASILADLDLDTRAGRRLRLPDRDGPPGRRPGGRIVEIPIRFTDRTRGRSKMSGRIVAEALLLVTWWGSATGWATALGGPGRADPARRPGGVALEDCR